MSNGPEDSSAADWNVELTAETADKVEAILRDFATDAELEMAVIVDQSGGMIAGVATRQNVDVSTVGALVAGAFGAMAALARELGEPLVTESLHHGSGDTIYLRKIGERFVLLGVTSSDLPSGLVRERGAQIVGTLAAMLSGTHEEAADEESAEPTEEPVESEVVPQPQVAVATTVPVEPLEPAPPIQTDVFVERPVSIEQGSVGELTGSGHSQPPADDDHAVSMTPLHPQVAPRQPAPEPEPQKEEPGENRNYVFEIG